jgi:8-oxo-dGTP pyrophosphatase MutT (NUDIX family)
LRPRDAATLILVRDGREVLLGVRSAGHVFMPHMYVFPGGRVDPGDARVASPFGLAPIDERKLTRSVSAARARAIAMTAVRETFEETGLILGRKVPSTPASRSPHWRPVFDTGHVPALDRMRYVARAITPPGGVRRYDARFFLADAKHVSGQLQGNGELEDLRWVDLDHALELPLSPITELVLDLLADRLRGARDSEDRIPLYRSLRGKELVEHE